MSGYLTPLTRFESAADPFETELTALFKSLSDKGTDPLSAVAVREAYWSQC